MRTLCEYVHAYMYVNICTHTRKLGVHNCKPGVQVCRHTPTHIPTDLHTHTYAPTHQHTYVYMYVYAHTVYLNPPMVSFTHIKLTCKQDTNTDMYVFVCTHFVYTYSVFVYIYVQVYTHTHTRTNPNMHTYICI